MQTLSATLVCMADHTKALAKAAAGYTRSGEARNAARQTLIDAIRAARADGVKQADILRAINHVWTRDQIRRVSSNNPHPGENQ